MDLLDASTPTGPPATVPTGTPGIRTLIDDFLADQGRMSAVEKFSQRHDDGVPDQARYYRDLIPATPPGPGQQYAFEVDLDSCTGCKACVTGCSSLNGLDAGETWRSVGEVVGSGAPRGRTSLPIHPGGPSTDLATATTAVRQNVTTACHHCVDPGCLQGCPVEAYEKDPETGIVKHLDDQCIGCGYCLFTCPYDVPKFDEDRGIVRKCDMCTDRLAVGEAPACVQACPTQAITIRLVDVAAVVAEVAAGGAAWPFPAPRPALTTPTTRYVGTRDLSGAESVDLHLPRPGHAHPPLAVMLVLTQFAVGTFVVDLLARLVGGVVMDRAATSSAIVGLVVAMVALAASILHLGRPRYAYRALLGLRHSWLSREILAFSIFAAAASLTAGVRLLGLGGEPVHLALDVATAAAGLAGVLCSVMIYAVTGRTWWRGPTTLVRFLLTTAVGGLATVLVTATATGRVDPASLAGPHQGLTTALAVAVATKLVVEVAVLRHRRRPATHELPRTARLLARDLRRLFAWRLALGAVGGIAIPAWATALAGGVAPDPVAAAVLGIVALALVGAGELAERTLFFTALASRRMPGSLS